MSAELALISSSDVLSGSSLHAFIFQCMGSKARFAKFFFTELKSNQLVREVSSVDDASSGEEPHTYSGSHQETTKPLLDATRSSVSGAEEETSVTGTSFAGTSFFPNSCF